MITLLARCISLIANPVFLLIPVPYLLVVRETGDPMYAIKWTVLSLFFVFLIGLSVVIAVRKGYFANLDVSKREQRPLLFLIVGGISILYYFCLVIFEGPIVLFITLAAILFSVLVFSFINTRIKASIHVATMSALIFSLSILYSGKFLLLLILIPIIGWSRLHIKRHTMKEMLVGGITGILVTLLFYIVFKLVLGISVSV